MDALVFPMEVIICIINIEAQPTTSDGIVSFKRMLINRLNRRFFFKQFHKYEFAFQPSQGRSDSTRKWNMLENDFVLAAFALFNFVPFLTEGEIINEEEAGTLRHRSEKALLDLHKRLVPSDFDDEPSTDPDNCFEMPARAKAEGPLRKCFGATATRNADSRETNLARHQREMKLFSESGEVRTILDNLIHRMANSNDVLGYRTGMWGDLVGVLEGPTKWSKWIPITIRAVGAWQSCSNVNENDFSIFQDLYGPHRLQLSEVTSLAYFLTIVEADLCQKVVLERILQDLTWGAIKPLDKHGKVQGNVLDMLRGKAGNKELMEAATKRTLNLWL